MKTIKNLVEHINHKQAQFAKHTFFKTLEKISSIEAFLSVVSDLAFWVMTFQDVLRLNEARVKDPYLYKLARHHRMEDKGHEQWFLKDVTHLESKTKCDIKGLFDAKNTTTRDAAYAIVSEVYHVDDELLRIILLFTLESTGHIFFEKSARFVDDKGYTDRLKYFSTSHLDVEKAHAIFEAEMEKKFLVTPLSLEQYSQGIALVDRVYDAFYLMFNGLVSQMNKSSSQDEASIQNIA